VLAGSYDQCLNVKLFSISVHCLSRWLPWM